MSGIPLFALEKMMKSQGADRVSKDASKKMKEILENHLAELGTKASKVAAHSGRKTIQAGDIEIANM